MAYGLLDSLWQVFCYYTMGAMSNDPRKLAYYAGFYKSIQAVGATTISKLDAVSLACLFSSVLAYVDKSVHRTKYRSVSTLAPVGG